MVDTRSVYTCTCIYNKGMPINQMYNTVKHYYSRANAYTPGNVLLTWQWSIVFYSYCRANAYTPDNVLYSEALCSIATVGLMWTLLTMCYWHDSEALCSIDTAGLMHTLLIMCYTVKHCVL